jgi:hypothetical protein
MSAKSESEVQAELETELARHDWYSQYSDSPSVVQAARDHWAKIGGLIRQLPAGVGNALVDKYRPKL